MINNIGKYVQEQKQKVNVSVAVDWLTVYYKFDINKFSYLTHVQSSMELTNKLFLTFQDGGTRHFGVKAKVYYKIDGESYEVGTLQYESRNEKIFAKDCVKFDFKNNALYSFLYLETHNELIKFGLKWDKFGRLDIAIDGCNYLVNFLNAYVKENPLIPETLIGYKMINANYKRNLLHPGVYNPKLRICENFRLGSRLSKKYLTIYNKSLEIDISKKDYIKEFWYKNGVIKETAEQHNFKDYTNIYRCEFRLSAEFVNTIKDINLERLTDVNFLVSVLKYSTANFFGAVEIATGKYLELLPFNKFKIEKIEFVDYVSNEGEYKAKMTIHGLIQDIYACKVKKENINETIEVIFDRVHRYKLYKFLKFKMRDWAFKYCVTTPEDKKVDVDIAISEIKQKLNYYLYGTPDEILDRAKNNQQPPATARFGNELDI